MNAQLSPSELFAFREIVLTKEIGIIKDQEEKFLIGPCLLMAGQASSSAPGREWIHSALWGFVENNQ